MELSQFTDYALRSLIYVGMRGLDSRSIADQAEAQAQGPSLPSVREIAEAFRISQNHLVKVIHKLALLGYIETFRGRGGGILLAMAPSDIVVGTIVRQTENLSIVECLAPAAAGGKSGGCCIAPACELKRALAKARDAFLASLDTCTLADLLAPHHSLMSLLHPTTTR